MFVPKRIMIEKEAMDYDVTKQIISHLNAKNEIEIINLSSNKLKQHIPGEDLHSMYRESKKTLVIGAKKSLKFQTCKPSAHYQLPLVSGCMGQCEYCYLNTMLGDKPFIKVHVNVDEILNQAQKYIDERNPEITIFEGAATSDPIPVEPYTHALEQAIHFFGENEYGRFRFVTKYNDVDTLLSIKHNGHTEIRFSINTPSIIDAYEHATASCNKRLEASMKVMEAGYPVGYLVAPVFLYPGWKEEYHQLLVDLKRNIPSDLKYPITFEIISHRYTSIAKSRINEVFPETTLPMNEEERKFKYGQFGYGKYVYPKENMDDIKSFFTKEIEDIFDHKELKYII
jgi:spore photoproduct lyase